MGTIKDRNSKDLTEADLEIKKRGQEYTEELYQKSLNDPDNHDGMVTHLELDILECEVKWALGSILKTKLERLRKFQFSYSKSKKMLLLKWCTHHVNKFGKPYRATGIKKVSFHSNLKEGQC